MLKCLRKILEMHESAGKSNEAAHCGRFGALGTKLNFQKRRHPEGSGRHG